MTDTNLSQPFGQALSPVAVISQRLIAFALVVYAVFAPHSIAVTQGAYLFGMLVWAVELLLTRKLRTVRTPVDLSLLGFFACCVVSSFLSYYPLISIKGLRSPAFFLAFYFVCNRVSSLRFAKLLGYGLIVSCLVNVGYSGWQLAKGRGVRIDTLSTDSAFARAGLRVRDVIIKVDGQKVSTAAEISQLVDQQRGRLAVIYQRNESTRETTVSRRALVNTQQSGIARLGMTTSPGRSFRVSGFYSHYETYAEVLQLIAALALGLFISQKRKASAAALGLAASVLLIAGTIILTSTRAAIFGLVLATAVMALASARRRVLLASVFFAVVFIPVAIFALQQSRGISFVDLKEGSTAYRVEVWGEALRLIKMHPFFGIGKGSEGNLKERFQLFGNGKLPPGHFHSTPIQVATWWGLPALAFYCAFMTIFFFEMWRFAQRVRAQQRWDVWGLTLGGMGAFVAFHASSLFHFNFGDGEVVMTFWLLMGLVFAARRLVLQEANATKSVQPATLSAIDSHKNLLPTPEATAESSFPAAKARSSSKLP